MSFESPDISELIGRIRRQSDAIDADWLFGPDPKTVAPEDTDPELSAAAVPEVPGWIGRFEILGTLGRGGGGIVLLAVDPDLHRRVALKLPHPEVLVDERRRRRFLTEGEAAASLNHPHIVTVYEEGQVGSVNYIVSEYIRGGTLAQWLLSNPRALAPETSAGIARVMAEAVQHAHSRGVLHRDIKPGNILLDGSEIGAGELASAARLSDFGMARMVSSNVNNHTRDTVLGTPAYMAPEQAEGRNKDVDATSDVYSLGAVLYELLAGEPPFQRETHLATLMAISRDEVVPPSRQAKGIPRDLEAICLKCLDKRPNARYPTAQALADDLRRFLSGETIEARTPIWLEKLGRWSRRNPLAAGLFSLLAMLTLLIAVGTSLAAIKLRNSRDEVLDHLRRETQANALATKNKSLALRTLFDAQLARASAIRRSRMPGRRLECLQAVQEAARLIPQLGLGSEERLLLRNEALAGLSLVDLAEDEFWPDEGDQRVCHAVDADVERYAYYRPHPREVVVRRIDDNRILATLFQDERLREITAIVFGSDGKHLACAVNRKVNSRVLQVWNLETQECLHTSPIPTSRYRPFDFSRDGKSLAVGRPDGSIEILSVTDFSVQKSIPVPRDEVPAKSFQLTGGPAWLVRFHPKGTQIYASRGKYGRIFNLTSNRWSERASYSGGIDDVCWSDDGRILAIGHGEFVTITRTSLEKNLHAMSSRTLNLPARVAAVSCHPNGELLATYSDDNMTRIWSINDGRMRLGVAGRSSGFSRDGRWLSRAAGRWRVVTATACRALRHPRSSHPSSEVHLSVHKRGRLLASSNPKRTLMIDLKTGQTLARTFQHCLGKFDRSGEFLVLSKTEGIFRQRVEQSESDGIIQPRFGPMETVLRLRQPSRNNEIFLTPTVSAIDRRTVWPAATNEPIEIIDPSKMPPLGTCYDLATSSSGDVVVSLNQINRASAISLHNARTGLSGTLPAKHRAARWLDVSPDGKWFATGGDDRNGVYLWDAPSGKRLTRLAAQGAKVAFSRDSKWLAIDDGKEFRVVSIGDEEAVVTNWTRTPSMAEPGCAAFSSDGRLVAMLASPHVVRLIDAENFSEVARLALPEGNVIESITFCPEGNRLIAASRGSWGTLHIWNLHRLHTGLAEMGLNSNLKLRPH